MQAHKLTPTSTQTSNDNKQPENRTDGGAAEKEKEEVKSKTAALEKFLEKKNCHIRTLNAVIQEMKERQGSEIQFIKRKEEVEKSALLCKIRDMRVQKIATPPATSPIQGQSG
jgi:phage host-nuclease inhibitor protein Gam